MKIKDAKKLRKGDIVFWKPPGKKQRDIEILSTFYWEEKKLIQIIDNKAQYYECSPRQLTLLHAS
jgi:hypothetical protein